MLEEAVDVVQITLALAALAAVEMAQITQLLYKHKTEL
jgi:hypothetical protein